MTKKVQNTGKATANKATANKKNLKVVEGKKGNKPAIAPSKTEVVEINKPTLKEIVTEDKKQFIKEFVLCDKEFDKAFKDVENSALKVAQLLYYIEVNKLYECDGYRSTAHYAGENYGMSKGTVSKYIHIVERFGKDIEDKKHCFKGMRVIQDKYKDFSWSKLAVLAGCDNAIVDKCKPNMTYKNIMDLIKAQGKQDALIEEKQGKDEEKREVTTKEIPTLSTELIFEIKTVDALDLFVKSMQDKEIVDGFKKDIESGKVLHLDRIILTNNKKVEAK